MKKMKKVLSFVPSALYYAMIFYISSRSVQIDIGIRGFDKLLHVIEFSGVGFLLTFGFCKVINARWIRIAGLSFTISLVLAALDEWHQYYIPGRDSNVLDLLADGLGIALGVAGYILLALKARRKSAKMTSAEPQENAGG